MQQQRAQIRAMRQAQNRAVAAAWQRILQAQAQTAAQTQAQAQAAAQASAQATAAQQTQLQQNLNYQSMSVSISSNKLGVGAGVFVASQPTNQAPNFFGLNGNQINSEYNKDLTIHLGDEEITKAWLNDIRKEPTLSKMVDSLNVNVRFVENPSTELVFSGGAYYDRKNNTVMMDSAYKTNQKNYYYGSGSPFNLWGNYNGEVYYSGQSVLVHELSHAYYFSQGLKYTNKKTFENFAIKRANLYRKMVGEPLRNYR